MKVWERSLSDIEQASGQGGAGFRRSHEGRELWLIYKTNFLKRLGLPTHYMREVEVLLQRDCLVSNERSRGSYKTRVNGELQRFFALRLDQVRRQLEELERIEHED
ncbi:hypothetical protein OS145_09755 [Idiomarina baltica OS145]|uniref:Uncharacterized protein n=1 Tax=Idiomarina baltica OS145 TaxID=314276 RepID=A0ABM9WKZ1_9GAMM|nr:hypothetical protein OS145_09755 [Idiomarina baltica OS145]